MMSSQNNDMIGDSASFSLRISSVNVTKSAGNYRVGHIYWRNP